MGWFDCPFRLGIGLNDRGLEAAVLRIGRRGRARVIKTIEVASATPLLDPPDTEALTRVLRKLVKALPGAAKRADLVVNVALPEALVWEDVLSFDTFPEVRAEADALVAHRMARDNRVAPGLLGTAWEVVDPGGASGAPVLVRVRAIPSRLRDAVAEAAAQAGLAVARLDGWLGFEPDPGGPGTQSLLSSDGETWALVCADAAVPGGFCDAGLMDGDMPGRVARLHRSFAMARGAEAGVLLVDGPENVQRALAATGVALEPAGREARPVRVAQAS